MRIIHLSTLLTSTLFFLICCGNPDLLKKEFVNSYCNQLKTSNSKILILYDNSIKANFLKIYKQSLLSDCQNIIIKKFDGIVKNDFISLLKEVNNSKNGNKLNYPELLDILFSKEFEFDKIYCLRFNNHSGNRYYPSDDKLPNSKCFKHKFSLQGYICMPFTIKGVNQLYQFDGKTPKEILTSIIDHSLNDCYSFESVDKNNLKNLIIAQAESYFKEKHYTNSSWNKDIIETFKMADLYCKYDNKVNDYLIESYKKNPGPKDIRGLKLLKQTFDKHISNKSILNNFNSWLESNLTEANKESEAILSSLNTVNFSLYSNLKGKYKDEAVKNFSKFKISLYKYISTEKIKYALPKSLTIAQENNESVNISLQLDIDENKFINSNSYDANTQELFINPWMIDLLENDISYTNYFNNYELILNNKSGESLTIFAYKNLTDWENTFKKMLISNAPGNEYQQDILRERIKLHYHSYVKYNSKKLRMPLLVKDVINHRKSGILQFYLGKETRDMINKLNPYAYLHKFFKMDF